MNPSPDIVVALLIAPPIKPLLPSASNPLVNDCFKALMPACLAIRPAPIAPAPTPPDTIPANTNGKVVTAPSPSLAPIHSKNALNSCSLSNTCSKELIRGATSPSASLRHMWAVWSN